MATHSVGQQDCRDVRFVKDGEEEGHGRPVRLVEDESNGELHVWGTVRSWDPPNGFSMSWHPGAEPEQAQELEMSFQPEGRGTRVRLVHRSWEGLGERGPEVRGRYDEGWMHVLELFVG